MIAIPGFRAGQLQGDEQPSAQGFARLHVQWFQDPIVLGYFEDHGIEVRPLAGPCGWQGRWARVFARISEPSSLSPESQRKKWLRSSNSSISSSPSTCGW